MLNRFSSDTILKWAYCVRVSILFLRALSITNLVRSGPSPPTTSMFFLHFFDNSPLLGRGHAHDQVLLTLADGLQDAEPPEQTHDQHCHYQGEYLLFVATLIQPFFNIKPSGSLPNRNL